MFSVRAVALVLLLAGTCVVLSGEDASPVERKARLSWIQGDLEQITLGQAIEMALQNNLDAQVDRVSLHIARDRVWYSWGVFDPVFSINATRESLQTPQNATNISNAAELQQVQIAQQTLDSENQLVLANRELAQQVAIANGLPPPVFSPLSTSTITDFSNEPPLIFESENFRLSNQLQGKTPLGTTYGLGLEMDRRQPLIQGVDRQFVVEDSATALFNVQQPLLRDFGPAANLAEVRINRRNKNIASLTWQQSVTNAMQTVITTYIDMIYSLENVRVREEAVHSDQQIVQGNQRRLDVGIMSPIDVRQAQVAVSEDQEVLISAKNQFMESQFALKRAILRDAPVENARVFIPATIPSPEIPALDPLAWKRVAFQKRLDYRSVLEQAEIENIRLRFARNQLLPKLDLVASYGLNGLTTNYGSAVSSAFQGQAQQWSVGIVASIPLGNIQARAQLDIAKGFKEQALLKIKQAELTIDVDVDTVISRIKTNIQRVETAMQSRRLGEEAMNIQNKRLEQGQVSSFDLLDTQKRLYEARTRELSARDELDKSIVQLWFSSGTLLDRQHIVVDENETHAQR